MAFWETSFFLFCYKLRPFLTIPDPVPRPAPLSGVRHLHTSSCVHVCLAHLWLKVPRFYLFSETANYCFNLNEKWVWQKPLTICSVSIQYHVHTPWGHLFFIMPNVPTAFLVLLASVCLCMALVFQRNWEYIAIGNSFVCVCRWDDSLLLLSRLRNKLSHWVVSFFQMADHYRGLPLRGKAETC